MFSFTDKPWWYWCKMAGWPLLLIALHSNNTLVVAMAAHWFLDFTCQGHKTSIGKAKKNQYVLAYHSFLSGGYPGFIAGGLAGFAVSIVVHYLIDWLVKPNLGDTVTTRVLDQIMHAATIAAIWWLCN